MYETGPNTGYKECVIDCQEAEVMRREYSEGEARERVKMQSCKLGAMQSGTRMCWR